MLSMKEKDYSVIILYAPVNLHLLDLTVQVRMTCNKIATFLICMTVLINTSVQAL